MDKITIERETLLPCPFCGDDDDKGRQEVTQMIEGRNKFARITCRACGAMCPEENWNRRAALAAQPDDNEWRTAIEDELICAHIGTADSFSDAQSALKSLIDWHVSVSLDPAVSSDAQALIDRGRAAQPAGAQQEPNMRHPKIQALIGNNARQHIWMMLVEQLVEDPHFETTAMDMEYWDTLHDKLKEKLTAAQPAPAAVPPGMALVPIEPTPGIITTGTVALMKASDSDLDATREEIAATYRAMIAAAGDKT